MVEKLRSINRDLLVRRCVECGYDGALLRDGAAPRCAQCGCDLEARPARSYAEMEGLAPSPRTIAGAFVAGKETGVGLQRWLAFLFFVLLGVVLLVGLAQAAMP